MAATIQIKRSTGSAAPSTLSQGELAYSAALSSFQDDGNGKLYIGSPSSTSSPAIFSIGGTFYTSKIDGVTAGTATGSKLVLLDADKSVTSLGTVGATTFTGTVITGSTSVTGGNLQLSGNTVSSTDTNGAVNINPNGTGSIVMYGGDGASWSVPRSRGTAGYVLTTNGLGSSSWQPAVSVLTFNNGAGSTGTVDLLTQTFSIIGGDGIDATVSGQSITLSISAGEGVVTVSGTQTLSNKSLVDTSTWFVDDLDQTKKFKFQAGSITTGQTRELTVQDQDGTVALLGNNLGQFASTTSDQLRAVISDETGTGSLVFSNSPSFTTPNIGAATATTVNGLTISSSTGTLNVANGSSLTLTGSGSPTNVNFGGGSTGTVAYSTDKLSFFSPTTSAELAGVITDETGSGKLVFATSPTLVTPELGAATAVTINGVTVSTASGAVLTLASNKTLAVNNSLTFTGTDASVVGFGAGGTVAYKEASLTQFQTLTTSQQFRDSVVSDYTGTGTMVFNTNATFVNPTLGAASATTINDVTITQSTATLSLASGSTLATSGANSITLTSTGATNVTLPTAGTLATLAGAETLTNKTISTGSTYQGNVIDILYGGTGSSNGSITGSGQLVFTAGGTNTSVVLAPNGTGTVDVSSKRITSVGEPTLSSDAATKNYVDNISTGIHWKQAVLARATTNVSLTSTTPLVIDGATISETGSRVLLNGQTDTGTNGIYSVTFSGGNYTLARTSDANSVSELEGAAVFVIGGDTWDNSGWIQSDYNLTEPSSGNFVPQVWVQFTGGGALVGGAGITITANTISADVDDQSINFSTPNDAGKIQIKDKGVTYAKIQDVTELSVVGRASNTTGTVAAITASSDYQILRRSGTSLAFGSIDLSQSGAVGTSILNVANGGTGLATATTNGVVFGNGTSAMGVTAAGTEHQVLRAGAGGVPSFGAVALNQGGVAVTGTLAVVHGGTGNASFTATQLLIGDGTNPVAQNAALTFAAAGTTGPNELTIGRTKIADTGSASIIISTTGTNGSIILAPSGTGIVSIGGPNNSSSSIGSAEGENLTITSGAALNLTAATTMTLTTTSSDIVMSLAGNSSYKVAISGPTAEQYATGITDNDLVTAYYVQNFATIDGGTY